MTVADLSKEIYSTSLGLKKEDFSWRPYEDIMLQVDNVELIAYQFKYSTAYVHSFFSHTYSFWAEFQISDWKKVFVLQKCSYIRLLTLIEFLYKYMSIDSIDLYYQCSSSTLDLNISRYFYNYPGVLLWDSSDLPKLDTGNQITTSARTNITLIKKDIREKLPHSNFREWVFKKVGL